MSDARYMKRCLQLAALGAGSVSPNPLVGAVLVHEGHIIGEGWHQRYGGPHAEPNAIADAQRHYDPELLRRSTLYVNLEPCSHWGKQPPCAELIVSKGIPRVVVGIVDADSRVCGRGIARLREAGVEVEVGLLEAECRHLNRRFFTAHQKNRPYVILKWAQTADGYLDAVRPSADIPPAWITGRAARVLVHRWRAHEDAILVGRRTAELDRPALTVREWVGRDPRRIILQGNTQIPELLTELWEKERIQSLIVEGGAQTLQGFIDAGLWDEARIFTATDKTLATLYPPEILPPPVAGVPAPKLSPAPGCQRALRHYLVCSTLPRAADGHSGTT